MYALFDDPHQLFDDPQLFDDQLKVWTLIIQKVYGDTFISDGLVYFSWTSAKLLSEVISTALANSRQIVELFIITIHVSEVLLLFKSREKSSFSTFAFWGRSFLSISTFNFLAGLFCMHLLLWLLLWCTRQPFEWNLISSEFDQKIAFGSYFSFQQLKIKIST